jgi:hypothetical protein
MFLSQKIPLTPPFSKGEGYKDGKQREKISSPPLERTIHSLEKRG